MAIKDLDTTENKNSNSSKSEGEKDNQDVTTSKLKMPGENEIKNAHATGDGSYGRNDESLPEEDAGAGKAENAY